MKGLLFFTDMHLHLWSRFSKPVNDPYLVNDRFSQQIKVLNDILDYAESNDYGIINGGDLFHTRGAVDSRVLYSATEAIASHPNVPITIVRGNHDSINNQMGSPASIDALAFLPNVTIVSNPDSMDIEVDGKSIHINFMPYGEDITSMKDVLKGFSDSLSPNDYNILVAHLGIDGAKQGLSTHRLASAFSLGDLYPDKYNAVYLGHFHLRQKLADNVWYGGSTMQLTFNDEGQEKGFDTLTFEKGNPIWKFHKVDYTPFITLTSWHEGDEEKYAGYYVNLKLPAEEAKVARKADVKDTNIQITAKVEDHTKARLNINPNTGVAEVTKKYTDKFFPELTHAAQDVIQDVLSGGDDK